MIEFTLDGRPIAYTGDPDRRLLATGFLRSNPVQPPSE